MRLIEGQLKETLKILTQEYVSSVYKMCSLHQQNLTLSKHQLYPKILGVLQFRRKTPLLDQCVKLLQNNYQEEIGNQCFQKDYSFHQSASRIMPSFQESDAFVDRKYDECQEYKFKKKILSQYRSNETTKYHSQKQQIFNCQQHILNASVDKVKMQENSNSIQSPSQDQDQDQDQDQRSDQDYQGSSACASKNIQPKLRDASHTMNRFTMTRKKYRSYTDQQRLESVELALQSGLQFASRHLNIPKKNITRWMKRKEKKEKIRGRKPGNPNMEENLTKWIFFNIQRTNYLTQTEIRNKAKQFSGDQGFKASKGWLQKYFRRNKVISQSLADLLVIKRNQQIPKKQDSPNSE